MSPPPLFFSPPLTPLRPRQTQGHSRRDAERVAPGRACEQGRERGWIWDDTSRSSRHFQRLLLWSDREGARAEGPVRRCLSEAVSVLSFPFLRVVGLGR